MVACKQIELQNFGESRNGFFKFREMMVLISIYCYAHECHDIDAHL